MRPGGHTENILHKDFRSFAGFRSKHAKLQSQLCNEAGNSRWFLLFKVNRGASFWPVQALVPIFNSANEIVQTLVCKVEKILYTGLQSLSSLMYLRSSQWESHVQWCAPLQKISEVFKVVMPSRLLEFLILNPHVTRCSSTRSLAFWIRIGHVWIMAKVTGMSLSTAVRSTQHSFLPQETLGLQTKSWHAAPTMSVGAQFFCSDWDLETMMIFSSLEKQFWCWCGLRMLPLVLQGHRPWMMSRLSSSISWRDWISHGRRKNWICDSIVAVSNAAFWPCRFNALTQSIQIGGMRCQWCLLSRTTQLWYLMKSSVAWLFARFARHYAAVAWAELFYLCNNCSLSPYKNICLIITLSMPY